MSDFLSMDGYGPYIWASYALTLVVLLANVFAARIEKKRSRLNARRRATSVPTHRRRVRTEIVNEGPSAADGSAESRL